MQPKVHLFLSTSSKKMNGKNTGKKPAKSGKNVDYFFVYDNNIMKGENKDEEII